jgi:MoaA/NifB/PqqE/SkfB family radical SAM enzyme
VVISLDSLTREVNEAMTGVAGSTEKIVHSIRRCADLSVEKGFQLSVHTVIAPETIDGVEDVLKFCESVGASLSVSPEHGRYRPCSDLVGDDGYRTLIDRLTELKGQGKPVFCSKGYLQTIRDFTPHCCFPFVSPRVEPDGRVYFPCQRIKDRHVYLQDYPNLYQLMQREAEWIEEPECSSRCYLACYVEVERYLRNPLSALKELPMRRTVADQRTEARRSSPEPDSRGV